MDDLNTVESIMSALERMAQKKETIGPERWLDAASKLNVLLQNEQDKAIELKMLLNKVKGAHLEEGKSAAYATAMVEAMDEWAVYEKQRALIDRVLETIRLAKKMATLEGEMRRNN